MKNRIFLVLVILFLALFLWLGYFYFTNLRGAWVAIKSPTVDVSALVSEEKTPLKLAPGFSLSIYASGLKGPRAMARDSRRSLLVSLPSDGRVVVLIDNNLDGQAEEIKTVIGGLKNPHGLAFNCVDDSNAEYPCKLYIAEEHQVKEYDYDGKNLQAINGQKLIDLPSGGFHITRSLLLNDNTLYVAVGSACNVCREKDSRRASILAINLKTKQVRPLAKGLRNSVFMTTNPADGKIWATDMGRDLLGDDLPPDEINILEEGKNYGWPICYGQNIHDAEFDKNTYFRNPCQTPFETPAHIDIPAHSAPLGLAFIPKEGWPQNMQGDLLVAYHGSWNRSVPTGYKVVKYHLDKDGKVLSVEDFLSRFLDERGNLYGRPVDILAEPGGVMFVSDDKAGVIYRIITKTLN